MYVSQPMGVGELNSGISNCQPLGSNFLRVSWVMFPVISFVLVEEKWFLRNRRFASLPGWALSHGHKSTGWLSVSNLSKLGSALQQPPGSSGAEAAGPTLQLEQC